LQRESLADPPRAVSAQTVVLGGRHRSSAPFADVDGMLSGGHYTPAPVGEHLHRRLVTGPQSPAARFRSPTGTTVVVPAAARAHLGRVFASTMQACGQIARIAGNRRCSQQPVLAATGALIQKV
jgi:hypothetical protein